MSWHLTFFFICLVSSTPVRHIRKRFPDVYRDSDRFFLFPGDGDGKVHVVDVLTPVNKSIAHATNSNSYWLYTRKNPLKPHYLRLGDMNSVVRSHFNSTMETVFLVHGWYGHGENRMNKLLKQAFLEGGHVNIIILDWSTVASQDYITAKALVPDVGRELGEFINWLITFAASYDQIHMVGFSLGAHLVGAAGKEASGQIRRITALDPAGPLWRRDRNRLRKSDARYVEVIHTAFGSYGYRGLLGDADFFPNGGSNMPGCQFNICSHNRAFKYMAASVRYNHLLANECLTLRDAIQDRCIGEFHAMGNSDLRKTAMGIFRVNTENKYPY